MLKLGREPEIVSDEVNMPYCILPTSTVLLEAFRTTAIKNHRIVLEQNQFNTCLMKSGLNKLRNSF